MNHALFYTWFQIVIDKLGGYSWNRLLASWIDVAEDNLVQETQTVGEIFIEIAGSNRKYDCCLGSRFMPESRIKGYSTLRVVGNYGFNWLFSLVAGHKITDLGSGLNLYAVPPLANGYYKKFPDTLYFNDCMILALCHLKQKVLFFPISWREEDQVSNNKLTSFGVSLLKLCGRYLKNKNEFVTREWREKPIEEYTSTIIASNL